ncbi:MAG TPA: transcriptional regulator [Xanthobacteraceae bacterium]
MTPTRKSRPDQRPRLTAPARKNSSKRNARAAVKGSHVGDDLVEAFEEMAKHLRGEIELQAFELPSDAVSPTQIKAIRLKVASSTKAFERLFGIPARTMEQGRRNPDGAMRALLRIIDREPKAALRALAA